MDRSDTTTMDNALMVHTAASNSGPKLMDEAGFGYTPLVVLLELPFW